MTTKSPSECFTAQTIPGFFGDAEVNPDVGGVAVAVSNIVINLALPIILRWTEDDDSVAHVQTSIVMLLSQVYPIMIATAGSINTDNLTLFDAHFAVAVTASPVSFYLVYSCIRDAIGRPNTLFSKLRRESGPATNIIRAFGLALPILWLGVNLTISFSPHAFKDSHSYCKEMTFARWFEFQTVSNFVGVLDVMGRRDIWNDLSGRGGLGAISLAAMWIWAVYLVRHRKDIYEEIRYRRLEDSARARASWFTRKWCCLLDIPAACWYVITNSHPWMIFVIIVCLHWSWILGIAKGMMSDRRYQLSYGQITSIFSAIPPLLSVACLLSSRRMCLYAYIKAIPKSFCEETRFLVLGSNNPWENHTSRHRVPTLQPSTACTKNRFWIITSFLWLILTGLDVWWIFEYVKGGSIPNPRTAVNDPHDGWKPFSVTMYIYGYCICYLNILIWTRYYEKSRQQGVKQGELPLHWPGYLNDRQRTLLRWLKYATIPIAFIMCVGPLFSPFAALPLAQEYQWSHFCDAFEGEVILTGAIDPSHVSTASFYYSTVGQQSKRAFHYNYTLTANNTDTQNWHTLSLNGTSLSLATLPEMVQISYNITGDSNNYFQAGCMHNVSYPSITKPAVCGYGRYNSTPYLSFGITELPGGEYTQLRAVDKEWRFPDDAPSVVVRFKGPDGKLGDIAIQSAVTQRNHCDTLKVCLPSRRLTLANLVPLGVILEAQEAYAQYCTRPRIYSI